MNLEKKNVLLLIQNLSNGGAEKAITVLASTLKENYNVTMVVFDNSIKEYIPNVDIIDLKIPDSNNLVKKIYNGIKRIKKVKKIKEDLNIDCSISYLSGPNIVNCLSRKKDKIIISIRNMQSKLKKNYLRDIVNQITLKKADKIITVSKVVEEDIKIHYKVDSKKITTIYNMIDKEEIKEKQNEEIAEKEIFLNDDIKVINIGRLILQKGQWHLIKAFKIVVEKYPKSKLIILGRGELEADFKKLIKKLNLQNNAYLLSFKKNPYKYLKSSTIFVSTSNYEGMSNVILEAMCCGLPIIATDCLGGTKEILAPKLNVKGCIKEITECEFGVLFPDLKKELDITENIYEEERKLAKIIIQLIEDKQKRKYYEQMSIERIEDFSNKKIIKKWIEIIDK